MRYTILYESSRSILINSVQAYCQRGWKPTGGVCYGSDLHVNNWSQAMIKEE